MKTINIGGVPEHFNYPWYLTLKNKDYYKVGIDLRWKDYPGGTGAMNRGLRSGDIDLAVILAEGVIKDIVEGSGTKIVQVFVRTPLIWGIHVDAKSHFRSLEDIKGSRAAISRYGSGSHLMAYVNAEQNNWDLNTDLNFEVIKNLDGAVEGLSTGKADYFMWEKFTTKPLVDSGVFRLIGEIPTPWPCFVIAVSERFIKDNVDYVKEILKIINLQSILFKDIPDIDLILSRRYGQKLEDIREWLSITEWSQRNIKSETVDHIQKTLKNLNIIDKTINNEVIIQDL